MQPDADNPPAAVAKRWKQTQLKTIPFPQRQPDRRLEAGESIAQSGRGMTWSDKPGAGERQLLQLPPDLARRKRAYGTIGPSLPASARCAATAPRSSSYVYGKIYNAKAYNACSHMPRLGHSGTLTEQQIKDLVALLLDPASPVNR